MYCWLVIVTDSEERICVGRIKQNPISLMSYCKTLTRISKSTEWNYLAAGSSWTCGSQERLLPLPIVSRQCLKSIDRTWKLLIKVTHSLSLSLETRHGLTGNTVQFLIPAPHHPTARLFHLNIKIAGSRGAYPQESECSQKPVIKERFGRKGEALVSIEWETSILCVAKRSRVTSWSLLNLFNLMP